MDRNRKDSLQLLRIQNDLNQLGIAIRDMLYGDEPYGLQAFKKQFDNKRTDLEAALRLEVQLSPVERGPNSQQYVADSLAQPPPTACLEPPQNRATRPRAI